MSQKNIEILFEDRGRAFYGLWRTQGIDQELHGVLRWENENLIFELLLREDGLDFERLPIGKVVSPPQRPTFVGFVSQLGTVTLEDCLHIRVRSSQDWNTNTAIFSVHLQPSSVWKGDRLAFGQHCTAFAISDPSLHGLFTSDDLNIKDTRFDRPPESENIENKPKLRLDISQNNPVKISINDLSFEILIGSIISRSSSNTEGEQISTEKIVEFHPSSPVSVKEAMDIIYSFEQFISLASIEFIRFRNLNFDNSDGYRISLVWIRANRVRSRQPMRHEILYPIEQGATQLPDVLNRWYAGTSNEKIARWLFCKALESREDSNTCFLSISQAWEVIGRDLGASKPFAKDTLTKIASAVDGALMSLCDEQTRMRFVKLIKSSNRRSYPETLEACFKKLLEEPIKINLVTAKPLAKRLAELRNRIVHMSGSADEINAAFSNALQDSYRLIILFALYDASQIGMTVDVERFLDNNPIARYAAFRNNPIRT